MGLTKDQQTELALRMRHVQGINIDAVINRVKSGYEKIKKGQKFTDTDKAENFLRDYALVRDIALAASYAKYLPQLTLQQFKQCSKLMELIEDKKVKSHTMFKGVKTRFTRTDLEKLFEHFATEIKPKS